jgi:hypothetical protein
VWNLEEKHKIPVNEAQPRFQRFRELGSESSNFRKIRCTTLSMVFVPGPTTNLNFIIFISHQHLSRLYISQKQSYGIKQLKNSLPEFEVMRFGKPIGHA